MLINLCITENLYILFSVVATETKDNHGIKSDKAYVLGEILDVEPHSECCTRCGVDHPTTDYAKLRKSLHKCVCMKSTGTNMHTK